jgi:hypothetical protein
MFTTLKNAFRYVVLGNLNAFDTQFYGEEDMARIVKNTDGSGTLFVDGQEVKTYARARDARRGATRLGYEVA